MRSLFLLAPAVLGASLIACSGAQAPTEQDFEKQYILEDTEEACGQIQVNRWDDVVFVSAKWRDLAPRADLGDPEAWAEIGRLMRQNQKSVEESLCTDKTIAEVEASAERLEQSQQAKAAE